jgi:hypothetical protein
MTDRKMEIIDETEIFIEALVVSVGLGELTVDQLKRQLEDGWAYLEANGAESVPEEILVALTGLDEAVRLITGHVYRRDVDGFSTPDAPSAASATLVGPVPAEAESTRAHGC